MCLARAKGPCLYRFGYTEREREREREMYMYIHVTYLCVALVSILTGLVRLAMLRLAPGNERHGKKALAWLGKRERERERGLQRWAWVYS